MDSISSTQPTNPFPISRAYGTGGPLSVRPVAGPPLHLRAEDGVRLGAGRVDSLSRVIAARVPGKVDFSGDQPRPGAASMPFYRHPADANAAATAIDLGRRVDISG